VNPILLPHPARMRELVRGNVHRLARVAVVGVL
jgi:hypothetical protein